MKTIAVTGSSGMLGRHIASRLKSDGFNVISFTRNKTNNSSNSRNWDLTNFASNSELDILFSDVDILVHAGAAVPGLQNIYGKDEFPTTKEELDILKYKPGKIIGRKLLTY